jgi:GrpB-like predicted nucleotidyltransferase (UPF0157 family)
LAPVVLVPYDPRWRSRFEEERVALEAAIGDAIVDGVHHVGSTSVPGLEAKPIVDILVGVRDLESSRGCFEGLKALSYVYAPYRAEEMHWFCKPSPRSRTHHLHLVPVDGRRYRAELAFRDYLRAHPDVADDYASLKRELAANFENDREAYTAGKDEFVEGVLERALADPGRESRPR